MDVGRRGCLAGVMDDGRAQDTAEATTGTGMVRVGTVFRPEWRPELLRGTVTAADSAGLDDLWLWEDCFAESGLAAATAALAWTSRITVGVGLMPVPLRNVAIAAMEVATIDRLFPGRFVPAIGHGVQAWMGQVDARVESPLTLLREYAAALAALLAGEEVHVDGRYVRLDGVRLAWPPAAPPRLVVGGEGPKTLALTAEVGGGTMLTSILSEAAMGAAITSVRAAGAAAGHRFVVHLLATRGADASDVLDRELARWPSRDEPVGVAGGAAEVAAAIDRLGSLGATTVLVHSVASEADPAGFARWVADEVKPLVSARVP